MNLCLLLHSVVSADEVKKAAQNPASGAGVKVGENVTTAVTKLNNGRTIPTVSSIRCDVSGTCAGQTVF